MVGLTKQTEYRNLGNEVSPEQPRNIRGALVEYRNLGNEVSPERAGNLGEGLREI